MSYPPSITLSTLALVIGCMPRRHLARDIHHRSACNTRWLAGAAIMARYSDFHMKMADRLKWHLAILVMAAMVNVALAQPPGAVTTTLVKTKATVTAVNPATREVTIQGDKGTTTVQAGPEVKNFANLKVGDQVLVSYYRGTLAEVVKGGEKLSDPAASTFAYGNTPGMKPAGGVGASATVNVKIQDVNLPTNTVAFTKADGTTHIVQVKSPEMQNFIRGLKRGDTVQVTFTDSIAVSVIPAS